MTDSCIQQILGKISAEGIPLKEPLLLKEKHPCKRRCT